MEELIEKLSSEVVTESDILWWDARDMLLSGKADKEKVHLTRAFAFLRGSSHEEAIWLQKLFPKGLKRGKKAKEFLMALTPLDGKALYFAAQAGEGFDQQLMWRAVDEFEYGPALGFFSGKVEMAQRGAFSRDRKSMYELARFYWKGYGIKQDQPKAVPLFMEAARRRCWRACEWIANRSTKLEYWTWTVEARLRHDFSYFLLMLNREMKRLTKDGSNIQTILAIGEVLRKYVSCDLKSLFVIPTEGHKNVRRVLKIISLVFERTRKKCVCWVLCAKRLQLCRDIRVIIAQMVWSCRNENVEFRWKNWTFKTQVTKVILPTSPTMIVCKPRKMSLSL